MADCVQWLGGSQTRECSLRLALLASLSPDKQQTGVSVATVHKVSSQYNQIGVAALETAGKEGRYNS
jgi:hypothetical protein